MFLGVGRLLFQLKEQNTSMKRQWDIEELIEHFTLVAEDEELLANKTGTTRLGFALLLKCFQLEGTFPTAKHEIPKDVVNYMAHQLKLEASLFAQYDWEGRTIKLHRTQIREQYHFRELKIEPPTPERVERLIQTACVTYEQQFFETVLQHLPASTREQLDALLERYKEEEGEAELEEEEPGIPNQRPEGRPRVVRWRDLKASPGAIGLESVLVETDKLRVLSSLALPADLFDAVSPRVARLYRERAATQGLTELRRLPVATRYSSMAALCLQLKAEIIDSL